MRGMTPFLTQPHGNPYEIIVEPYFQGLVGRERVANIEWGFINNRNLFHSDRASGYLNLNFFSC